MTIREYEAEGITVHWDAERCEHSGNCVAGSPSVFDPQARPWIRADATDVDALAATIDTCPSRALTYTRPDGSALGPGARTPADDASAAPAVDAGVTVTLMENGPIVLEGAVRVLDAAGSTDRLSDKTFLCRCGASATKPYCDGTHKAVGFTAAGVTPARKPGHP